MNPIRPSKKRPRFHESTHPLYSNTRRAVLGELTDPANVESTPPQKLICSLKRKKANPGHGEGNSENCLYASCIYDHLRSLEVDEIRRPLWHYMETVQMDMTPNMREVLVDWLVVVAQEHKLVSDTLYLTVSYIDRFLSSNPIARNKLQLLGVSCMLVASKYEEISPLHIEDFCYVTDNTYTKEEVMTMEKDVVNFLNVHMGAPTIKSFLRIMTRFAQENCNTCNLQFEFLGCYLGELCLPEYSCLRFLPSMVAASVIFLARYIIQPNMHPWCSALQCYSGYMPFELKECVLAIFAIQLSRISSSQAIREVYSQHKFEYVATLSSPPDMPAHYFESVTE